MANEQNKDLENMEELPIDAIENEEETDLDEATMAAETLKPNSKPVPDAKSKIGMMQAVMGQMHQMSKGDLTHWFNATMAQFGPGKTYGVGDNSAKNTSTIDMTTGKGPKTKDAMPKLNVKEDVEEMFNGYEISEEFKEEASTLFEAAISARVIAETARLEEEFAQKLEEQVSVINEELASKIDLIAQCLEHHFDSPVDSPLGSLLDGLFPSLLLCPKIQLAGALLPSLLACPA